MSRYRLWLFRTTTIIFIPALFLLSTEFGLRILGYGFPTGFIVKSEVNGRVAYVNNDKCIWLFFPPRLARATIPFVIPLEKPAKSYRIFVLGGSAAQGDPAPTFGAARILKILLQNQYPEINFEVINAAVTAINSHVVLQIAKDLACYQPDLFILYLGNNEVVGPFGAGTVFAPLSPNLSLIRASILLKSTRLGQALEKLLRIGNTRENLPKEWGGMQMFLQQQVPANDPGLITVYHHFRKNVEDILQIARKAGIETILSTVGTNVKDVPPFASLRRRDISEEELKRWNTFYQSGVEHESKGENDQAIQFYLKAAAIDGGFAELQYRLARCYWALQDYDNARKRYIQARDLDTLRFRADTKINTIIRKIAKERSVAWTYLVDTDYLFTESSPHKVAGNELFYDHVHMNFTGNYLLAKSLFRQTAAILPKQLLNTEKKGEPLTEEACSRILAFTGYDRHRVAEEVFKTLQKPPFTNQIDHEERMARLKQDLDALEAYTRSKGQMVAASQYRRALESNDSDPWLHYNYAHLLQAEENLEPASEHLRLFLLRLPQYTPAYEELAKMLILKGKFEEAVTQCKMALRINPWFAPVYYHLAFALAKMGRIDQSMEKYEELIKLEPEKTADIYNQMGKLQVQMGKLDGAVETFRKAIASKPSSESNKIMPEIHFNLGFVLKRLGKAEEAKRELQEAVQGYRQELRENPESAETHVVLAKALAAGGDYGQATRHLYQARDLDPADLSTQIKLIKVLEVQGRFDEAIAASHEAIRFMLNNNQQEAATTVQGYLQTLEASRLKNTSRP